MPKFISDRDVTFFKGIAREVVDDLVQTSAVLFKINIVETKTNIYGESLNKTWHPGVELYVLIEKQPQGSNYEGFGANTAQTVEFKFDRFNLEEKSIYPEVGDAIYFDNAYYEIDNVTEIQYSGGITTYNFSVVCSTVMVSRRSLNIEENIN